MSARTFRASARVHLDLFDEPVRHMDPEGASLRVERIVQDLVVRVTSRVSGPCWCAMEPGTA